MASLDSPTRHLAIDLGAESGRVMVGEFDGRRVRLHEAYRFPNVPLRVGDELHWNLPNIKQEVVSGIRKSLSLGQPDSIGFDAWGCDYALFQKNGAIMGSPLHYRDARTLGIPERVFDVVPEAEIYAATGSQTIRFNTIFQLFADQESGALDSASRLMMLPDALAFWLCGGVATEATIASTTQLFDPRSRDWAWPLIDRLNLPRHLFLTIEEPGTLRAPIRYDIGVDTGITSEAEVIAVASHDTASAVVATAMDGNTMFISSGTWSLAGIETTEPVINEAARRANFTNEAGASRTNRFLKNACGFWIVQECRRIWSEQGHSYDYDDLIAMAGSAPTLMSFIDPDHPHLLLPDDMPEAVREFCRRTGQPVPDSHGSLIRTVLESMALNYHSILESIEVLAQRRISRIQIVGGGSKNRLHCQFTANATGRPVVAGPSEATALGNIMVQAQGLDHISGLEEIREIIGNSYQPDAYEPSNDREQWDEAYFRFSKLKRPEPS
jgi:rhamnulokinase